ncbi:MAG: NifB/NifX family molybdenum-iron cluster-binding protein [Bacillota bacterium]
MIIAIPVNENNLSSEICPSFGRAPYFLIYDTSNDKSKFIENQASSSQGGAGVKASQTVIEYAEAILTPRLGRNSADVLLSAGVKIYKTEGDELLKNINNFKAGNLSELKEIHAGFHRH